MEIRFAEDIAKLLPRARLVCVEGKVEVKPSSPAFREFRSGILAEGVHPSAPAVNLATRESYKRTGKDPSRYRPSAEAMRRRVESGKGLFDICNLVDVLNLFSLWSGFSIGGYDTGKVKGLVQFRVGPAGIEYEAINRGNLNISGLPVLSDERGVFGSPTSDSMRTAISDETREFCLVVYDFGKELRDCTEVVKTFQEWLIRWAGTHDMSLRVFTLDGEVASAS